MQLRARSWLALLPMAALAACAGGGMHSLVSDTPVRVGRPYTIGGRVYVPADETQYDRTGIASWYGNREQGNPTANGERFDRRRVSAAHPTLPLPSYVTVTRLDTGRTMLVRINDRSPYARDRILDLSEEAARQLGIDRAGSALVRVRRVMPTSAERDTLRRGYPVFLANAAPMTSAPMTSTPRAMPSRDIPTASAMLAPPPPAPSVPPAARPLSPPSGAEYLPEPTPEPYSAPPSRPTPTPAPIVARPSPTQPSANRQILIASPHDPDAANALASALRGEGGHVIPAGSGYRVVTGPYPDEATRAAALARLRVRGYQGAMTLDAPTSPEATGNTLP